MKETVSLPYKFGVLEYVAHLNYSLQNGATLNKVSRPELGPYYRDTSYSH